MCMMEKTKKTQGVSSCVFYNPTALAEYINELIEQNALWKFYKSKEWIELKTKILIENHYECAECKKHGKITRYDIDKNGNKKLISTVHHVQFVRNHPELAMSRTYTYEGKDYPNLIPVCKACHNKLHPEKRIRAKAYMPKHFENEERW